MGFFSKIESDSFPPELPDVETLLEPVGMYRGAILPEDAGLIKEFAISSMRSSNFRSRIIGGRADPTQVSREFGMYCEEVVRLWGLMDQIIEKFYPELLPHYSNAVELYNAGGYTIEAAPNLLGVYIV